MFDIEVFIQRLVVLADVQLLRHRKNVCDGLARTGRISWSDGIFQVRDGCLDQSGNNRDVRIAFHSESLVFHDTCNVLDDGYQCIGVDAHGVDTHGDVDARSVALRGNGALHGNAV